MRLPWQNKSAGSGRQGSFLWTGLWLLAGSGLFLLGLLAGLYLFFPAETFKQRIVQEVSARSGVSVQISRLDLYPLLTLDVDRLKIELPELAAPLDLDSLTIVPQWMSLLSGDPGARLKFRAMNGGGTVLVQKSGAFHAEAAGMIFDLPIQKPFPVQLSGVLSDARLDSAVRLLPETKSRAAVRLTDVRVLGLEGMGAGDQGLAVGEILLELEGQGRKMEITSVTARGGVLDISGAGTVVVNRTLATSRIKLALQLRPAPNAGPAITSLLALAGEGEADGSYPLRISGTLDKPTLKLDN